MFRGIPLKVREILDRLKKLAAEAETKIARAKDHTHLRTGIMKMAAVTAMIDAAHGQTPGQQGSPVRSKLTFVALQAGVE
jgi:hypothetical protein